MGSAAEEGRGTWGGARAAGVAILLADPRLYSAVFQDKGLSDFLGTL